MTVQGGSLDEAIGDGAKGAVADAEVEISQEEDAEARPAPGP
jgi:hypothetical protein